MGSSVRLIELESKKTEPKGTSVSACASGPAQSERDERPESNHQFHSKAGTTLVNRKS